MITFDVCWRCNPLSNPQSALAHQRLLIGANTVSLFANDIVIAICPYLVLFFVALRNFLKIFVLHVFLLEFTY